MTDTEWYDDTDPPEQGVRLQDEDLILAWSDLAPGTRIRWKTQTFVKRGTIVSIEKRSMRVLFDSHKTATNIPDAKWYFVEGKVGNQNEHMVAISTLREEPRKLRRRDGTDYDYITPHDAANILGTDPKNIRRMIRTGRLPAHREGGRWMILRKDVEK